jgi:hypothetical protein
MSFLIQALDPADFSQFFSLPDNELARRNMRRIIVSAKPGAPCRVSLADAEIGETVLLLNYEHQPANSPFKSSHAIYVRDGVTEARLSVGEVPDVLLSRLISIRLFDQSDLMVDADVVEGSQIAAAIDRAFSDPAVAYVHLHYAKPGCFAASVQRA